MFWQSLDLLQKDKKGQTVAFINYSRYIKIIFCDIILIIIIINVWLWYSDLQAVKVLEGNKKEKSYIAIDLKSFYASAECVRLGLDPLSTNLVVADESRTDKTICLAVSPALKSFGLPGRARLFEVKRKVKEINAERELKYGQRLKGESSDIRELNRDSSLAVGFEIAMPHMAKYIEESTKVYEIYLKYISKDDIDVYSIDEVFMDATAYLNTYGLSARELAVRMIRDVLKETGITATAGIGTNLYLAKIAMDIVAKHMPADSDGVRIAELNEMSYRKLLWDHKPLTDFWRVGRGYEKKLSAAGIYTMGDIARCSIGKENDYYNEDLLYSMFGVNAELLIDHAWGWEPCTISDIKAYRPEEKSVGEGQVLMRPYTNDEAAVIVREMAEALSLKLVDKGFETDQIVLDIAYDIANMNGKTNGGFSGLSVTDRYGRTVPKPSHGSRNLDSYTSSLSKIGDASLELFHEISDKGLLVRRIGISAGRILSEADAEKEKWESKEYEQLSFFTDYEERDRKEDEENKKAEKERKLQEGMLEIRKKFGNNAILRGINFEEGATGRSRNGQIGGHKA